MALFAALLISPPRRIGGVARQDTGLEHRRQRSIPTTVSPGSYAAFRVTITNAGKSNIAKIYLTDSRTETPFSVTPSTGCKSTGPLHCSLGALGSGKSVTRVVVYKTPATGTSFPVTFEANTSGVSFSDGGTSHGDALRTDASTAMNGTGNFAGGYVVDAGSCSRPAGATHSRRPSTRPSPASA